MQTKADFDARYVVREAAGAWHPGWTGSESDVHLGPVQGVPAQVNATGRAAA